VKEVRASVDINIF